MVHAYANNDACNTEHVSLKTTFVFFVFYLIQQKLYLL